MPKKDDGFKTCVTCRKKGSIHAERKPHPPQTLPRARVTPYGVNLKTEIVDKVDEKAAVRGVSRNELFSWLVDEHLAEVKVW
jgi:hypothetical protein